LAKAHFFEVFWGFWANWGIFEYSKNKAFYEKLMVFQDRINSEFKKKQ
jgi:hypothetical protein